jgi:uncharacterized protein YgiM (DUF1202 family)
MKRIKRQKSRITRRTITLVSAFFLLPVISFISSCGKEATVEENVISENRMGIILTAGTALRIDPFIFSARLTLLKKGDTVKVLEKSGEKTWIGKSREYWYKVQLKDGITGWLFGKNLRLIAETNSEDVSAYVEDFFKEETDQVLKKITGKWWSVNRFGDFTYHGLEIFPDGKYKSYYKSANPRVREGEISIDFNHNKILFDKGTTFGKEIDFLRRGHAIIFRKELKVGELKFKQISVKVEEEEKDKEEKKKKSTKPDK